MSYVRGSKVEVSTVVRHQDDGSPYAPGEIVLTVIDPLGTVSEQRLSTNELLPDEHVDNRFVGYIDTTPSGGTWKYQFEVADEEVRTLEKREFTVKDRLPAAV